MDILGFREKIRETEWNSELRLRLLQTLKFITGLKKENDEGPLSIKEFGKEVTVFSDSIVLSYPLHYESCLFYMLIDLIHIQLELLFKGIIFRGGLVIGDVYHDGSIIFGPGMVSAYYLESRFAKYPRIILEKQTIIDAIKYKARHHSYEQELEYVMSLVKEDNDGFYFVNFLAQYQELDEPEYYYMMLRKVKEIILFEISRASEDRVLEKYEWIKNYYNETIKIMKLSKDYFIAT